MNELLLHPQAQKQLAQFIAQPGHALLLTAASGMGKKTLAEHLAAQLLELKLEKLPSYPHFSALAPDDKGTISIEHVRNVQKFLQLKTISLAPIRRIVLLENADALTIEAQNAFLKLLEEPPADTVLLLTTANKRALLPTILSRTQIITVPPPDQQAVTTYFAKNRDAGIVRQAWFLSGGLPGLMHALLQDGQEHPLLTSVRTAKDLLQKSTFERLAAVDILAKQKAEVANVLDALIRISLSALVQATERQDANRIRQWHGIRKEVLSAQEALAKSANTKLVLTKMLLHL